VIILEVSEVIVFLQKNWSWIAGVGGLFIAGISVIVVKVRALERGVQAMLRAQMITYYQTYKDSGVTLYVRQSFENCWESYEKLGKNGVMQDIHARFMRLDVTE
jgi:hypothetical protein